MSLKNKLFKEMFKISLASAAAQHAGNAKAPSHKLSCFDLRRRQAYSGPNPKTQPTKNWKKNLDPTQHNQTNWSTQPMDNCVNIALNSVAES